MSTQNVYHAIGLMSGTSMDGVDLAYCRFEHSDAGWSWKLLASDCEPWSQDAVQELAKLPSGTALDLAKAEVRLGRTFGALVNTFVAANNIREIDFVASHGHTLFHQPAIGLTTQVGSGAVLAATCNLPVVCDFRTQDVAYHGQGAPLVPIGDRLLFGEYEACLNLGGIANISYEEADQRIAFDIGPANITLNPLAEQLGKPYDLDGAWARSGQLLPVLLEQLNALPYYKEPAPKSLGREWIESAVLPLLPADASPQDLLHTLVEHSAMMIGANAPTTGRMLVTGGGALNSYFMERIRVHCPCEVVIPAVETIDYKEAIVFAFLGVLRMRGEANALASVTGASKNACSGAIYLP